MLLQKLPFLMAIKVISETEFKEKYFSFHPKATKVIQFVKKDNQSLWRAVNRAKDMNSNELPSVMVKGDDVVESEDLAEMFAEMFQTKVLTLASNAKIGPNVYNGMQKIQVEEKNFMSELEIRRAILSIKVKNCEGSDRIPQRIIDKFVRKYAPSGD